MRLSDNSGEDEPGAERMTCGNEGKPGPISLSTSSSTTIHTGSKHPAGENNSGGLLCPERGGAPLLKWSYEQVSLLGIVGRNLPMKHDWPMKIP